MHVNIEKASLIANIPFVLIEPSMHWGRMVKKRQSPCFYGACILPGGGGEEVENKL